MTKCCSSSKEHWHFGECASLARHILAVNEPFVCAWLPPVSCIPFECYLAHISKQDAIKHMDSMSDTMI